MLRFCAQGAQEMKRIWDIITTVRMAVANIVFLALLALILFAIFGRELPSLPDEAVLALHLSGAIVEEEETLPPLEQLLAGGESQEGTSLLRDLVFVIREAAADERIKAIALDLGELQEASLSQLEEIGASLAAFQATGKPVLSMASGYSQMQYYLASHADEVYLDRHSQAPFGGVFFTGLSVYPFYFKSALAKLHVKYHVFQAGLYKDAVEVIERDSMSELSREAVSAFLGSIWDGYVEEVAERRNLSQRQLAGYISGYGALLDRAGLNPAVLAERQGLVDGLLSREEWLARLAELAGAEGEPTVVAWQEYLAATQPSLLDPSLPQVAVILVDGVVHEGESVSGSAGADTVVSLIRQARDDDQVAALVVRVNSPGGSPEASEYIRRELQLTQEAGKPVVVSMGGVAASGGYWLSATANSIFASPSTVTGSIGVFAVIPAFDASLAALGVFSDGVGTTELSGVFDAARPLNLKMQAIFDKAITRTYRDFVGLVAEGRGLTPAEAEALAQGRVWAGAMAAERGLVDALGHTGDAIESAALLAGLEAYETVYVERWLSPKELFFRELSRNLGAALPALPQSLRLPRELQGLGALLALDGAPRLLLQCHSCRVEL